MNFGMHPIVTSIRSLLKKHTIPYTYMEHEPGSSSEEMVGIRKKYSLSEGAKALIVQIDSGFIQVVVPGDKKFSNKKLKRVTKTKNIRFANEAQLSEVTNGVLPGAVPPFGNLFKLTVYADQKIFNNKNLVFNCGERTTSIAMKPEDYEKVVRPIVVDITE